MKYPRWSKLLSLFLVLAMLVQMLPVTSFATENEDDTVFTEATAENTVVTVLGEVEELREENAKHFRLSDGSFVAVNYGLAVHYEDSDGNWQDIDNSIAEDAVTQTFNLERDDAIISFASSLTNGKVLTTSKDGVSITMTLLDSAAAQRLISGQEIPVETVPEETTPATTEETEPQMTEPVVTEPVETQPEETVPEVTDAPVTEPEETESEDVVAEFLPEIPVSEEDTSVEDVAVASESDEEGNDSEETEPVVAENPDEEEPTAPDEVSPEPTIPDETIPETTASEVTAPLETVPEETEQEETEAEETEPEETVPEETSATDIPDGLTYDRNAVAKIREEEPSLLELQETARWNVEDVIPANLQSSLVYENVFPDTDLLYTAYGYNLKEQIVVHSPQQSYRYDFLLNLDGLTALKNEDGSVTFLNEAGNAVYNIPIPYMEDESGLISESVTFTLTETEDGTVLTVEADASWINDEERVFPVKIDPSFTIVSGKALDEIYSVYTMEASPNDTTLGRQYLYVGAQPYSTTNDGRYRLFMHFNDMPSIPAGSEVVGASLSLYQHQYVQRYCPSFPIGVYEVTTDLPSSYSSYYNWFAAMTWRKNMPSYDTANCIDFAYVDATKGYRTWNVTELVKKWYTEGTSNTTAALIMMNEDEIDTYYYFASAAFYAYAGSIPPVLYVEYRNNVGIEPYYTYSTLGGGTAGTAYIADGTGQLKVGKELLSYASSVNPFSLNLIYNSDYFARSSSAEYLPPSKLGLSMNLGTGWTLDCIQKVQTATIDSVTYLKYTDGDGTEHYFRKASSPKDSNYPYYDEDGLGLKMKIDSTNNYTMADDHGNEWTFTSNYLTAVKDDDGNKITFTYSDGKLTQVKQENKGQTAVTVAEIGYNGNQINVIRDAAGNGYYFSYDGSKLVSITKNSTVIAQYGYTNSRLNKMTDVESNYSLSFTYANGKISSYKEIGGSTTGVTVDVTYPSHTQTTYRDYGADRTANTADDILTHYLFDYAGRTANAYTTDNDGNILGATNAAYQQNSDISKKNNRTIRTASIGVAGQQLLRDTSLENGSGWTYSGASRSTSKARTGAYAVKSSLSSNGTHTAQTTSESLVSGKTYTLSAYVNTSGVTRFDADGISLYASNGTSNYESNPVAYKTDTAVDGGWVRLSLTFTATSSGAHTVGIRNNGAIGTVYADDFQLELGEAPSSHNLVENGSMEMSGYGWTMGTGAAFSSTRGVAGSSKSLLITGDPEAADAHAYQDVTVNQSGSQTYVLSGWVYANAVPDDDEKPDDTTDTNKECGLRAVITYSDETTETHYVSFNADLSKTWQFASLTIVPKQPSKQVSTIRVVCVYEKNANKAYFDNISLLREAAQTMKYDDDGNLVSVTTSGLKEETDTYSGGNLIKTVTGGNGTYEYTYDTTYKHRLKSVTNSLITQSMEHDAAGNVTTTTLSGSGDKKITTSATYGGSLNRLTSVTDATGAKVSYGYGDSDAQMMALPTSITDPNGTVTTTSYDSNYRVMQTGIANIADLVYNYSNGNLSSVQRSDADSNTQTYSFVYDDFGNMTSLKVGSQTLATYSYYTGNGLLKEQVYANADKVSFTYDNLGRTKTTTYSDGRTLTYTYNGEGQLHSLVESNGSSQVTYLYTYDSIGRLIFSQQNDGDSIVLLTHQSYNENNQLTGQSWQVGDTAYAESYTYSTKDGSLDTMTNALGETLTMEYDGLRRLSKTTGGAFNRAYSYQDISSTQTTMQVSQLSYPNLGSGVSFGYTYDTLGNIATYTAPDGEKITYTYDAQGQLLKAVGDETYTYTYDSVGNILTANGHTYTYGNANWKDLLTEFDGHTITYDQSGNPIGYYNGTTWAFTWSNGRSLTRAVSTTQALDFTYDSSGLRTSKTVDGVTHKYLYAGGKLMRETYGSNTLDFFYDANGTPYALKYNGTVYYYITNLQGDVIQIVDASGNAVATYEYDPYGKVISATGTLAETNPIRYRGYYYDSETGLYYLQSRYYDPELSRFINCDNQLLITEALVANLFTYCVNNPINGYDPVGESDSAFQFTIGIGLVALGFAVIAAVPTGGASLALVGSTLLVGGSLSIAGTYIAGNAVAKTPVSFAKKNKKLKSKNQKTEVQKPNVTYPGDDSSKSPGDDYEWHGKEPVGGDKGAWINPNTGEQWHPDLDHPLPKGPHWDYTDIYGIVWSVFKDGRIILW